MVRQGLYAINADQQMGHMLIDVWSFLACLISLKVAIEAQTKVDSNLHIPMCLAMQIKNEFRMW
jgi:hypothetical protein